MKVDNNQKLKFYGLYKVATVGKYSEKNKLKAGFFDFSTKYKNEAWEKCSIYSEEEEMIEYIKFYCELTGEKMNIDLTQNKTTKSIDDITLDVPEGLESQGMYSSTAKESKEKLNNFLIIDSINRIFCIFHLRFFSYFLTSLLMLRYHIIFHLHYITISLIHP